MNKNQNNSAKKAIKKENLKKKKENFISNPLKYPCIPVSNLTKKYFAY